MPLAPSGSMGGVPRRMGPGSWAAPTTVLVMAALVVLARAAAWAIALLLKILETLREIRELIKPQFYHRLGLAVPERPYRSTVK